MYSTRSTNIKKNYILGLKEKNLDPFLNSSGSEQQTSLVFKWSKKVCLLNGPLFKTGRGVNGRVVGLGIEVGQHWTSHCGVYYVPRYVLNSELKVCYSNGKKLGNQTFYHGRYSNGLDHSISATITSSMSLTYSSEYNQS